MYSSYYSSNTDHRQSIPCPFSDPKRRYSPPGENNGYTELKLSKGKKEVSLFVDQQMETNFKTEEDRHESDDVFLATLSLDHLGLVNRALFVLGFLSILYVSTPW
jgi:hypothetical protein